MTSPVTLATVASCGQQIFLAPIKYFSVATFPRGVFGECHVFGGSRDPVSWVPLVTLSRGAGDAAPRPGDKNPDVTSFIFVSRWRPRPGQHSGACPHLKVATKCSR